MRIQLVIPVSGKAGEVLSFFLPSYDQSETDPFPGPVPRTRSPSSPHRFSSLPWGFSGGGCMMASGSEFVVSGSLTLVRLHWRARGSCIPV